MKKLTASIFATLLMAVSVGTANADIASSQYVDDKVGTVETSVTTLSGRVGTAEREIETLETGLNAKLDSATAASTYATQSALTSGLADKQDKELITSAEYATNLSSETGYPSVAAVEAAIEAATDGMVTDVSGKVNIAQGADSANRAVITGATGDITTGQIATGMISDGAVTSAKIGTDAVGSAQIATGAVTSDELAADAVTADKIADGVITTTEISATAGITATQLSTGVQTSLGLADTAVQEADLAGYAKTDALAKKQDKLTETQQAAVDSGITTEKVAAYDAYATSKADKTALSALEGKVTANTTNIGTNTTAIGTLTNLKTTEKTNLVGAINEVDGDITTINSALADKIPMPDGECSDPTNKCVLVSNGTTFEWEVIARGVTHEGGANP